MIVAGLTHFSPARAFDFPAGAFHLSHEFFIGLGAAMLIATYDYWGYYNVCFHRRRSERSGPHHSARAYHLHRRGGGLYIVMNISVLGVIPWREMTQFSNDQNNYIISVFMQRIYGNWAGRIAAGLIMWTAFASVFSLLLGYSRVPYAAALDGNYFRVFARVHPQHRFPTVSLLALGGVAMLFCFLRLADVIAALVVIRIMLQFIVQAVGVMVLRLRQPDMARPFRMWLYPLPALLAIAGFSFILVERKNFLREIRYAIVILVIGLMIYFVRSWRRREWPFAAPVTGLGAAG